MKSKLYRMETYGIKNIENSKVINFQPYTFNKNKLKKDVSKIKAIYGTNGAGKTAIVQSVYFYKAILEDSDYLRQKGVIRNLKNLLNKKVEEFYISMIFESFQDDMSNLIYKHELNIYYDDVDDQIYIKKEKLSTLKDKTINGEYITVFEVNNGELCFFGNKKDDFIELLYNKSQNMLRSSSLISLFSKKEILESILNLVDKNEKNQIMPNKTIRTLLDTRLFAKDLFVYLNKEDNNAKNSKIIINEYINILLKNKRMIEDIIEHRISSDDDFILRDELEDYRLKVNRLAKFIKVFKPELEKIELEIKEDGDFLHCRKIMNYSNYLVDTAYESTGIRKLMRIYNSIEYAAKGKIVFIDELDANISSVYLNKLLEYLQIEGEGQLCFTTHNLLPMNYLYQLSQSIDFIGETGKIISWKKNGNYKPYNLYPEGMIEDSPFNVEYYDFIEVFTNEGDE